MQSADSSVHVVPERFCDLYLIRRWQNRDATPASQLLPLRLKLRVPKVIKYFGNFNTSHLYPDEFELIEGHGINGLHIRCHYASFNMHALLQPVMICTANVYRGLQGD